MNTITLELAQQIVACLGNEWTLVNPHETRRWFHIQRNDGLSITIGSNVNTSPVASYKPFEKVDPFGDNITYPRYADKRPSISFSLTKGDAKIAADILNRLIPQAEEMAVKALKELTDHETYCNLIRQNYATIVSYGNDTVKVQARYANSNNHQPDFHTLNLQYAASHHVGYGDITINDKDCKMVLPSLPVELVNRILQTMTDYIKEQNV